jgi:hypothetical protein
MSRGHSATGPNAYMEVNHPPVYIAGKPVTKKSSRSMKESSILKLYLKTDNLLNEQR